MVVLQCVTLCLLLPAACSVNADSLKENDQNGCLNVEDPEGAAAEGKSGDRQCFAGDNVGMVCGWDGTAEQAYCELSATGLKVCARRKGGGRCKEGQRTPITSKKNDKAPEQPKEQFGGHDGSGLNADDESQEEGHTGPDGLDSAALNEIVAHDDAFIPASQFWQVPSRTKEDVATSVVAASASRQLQTMQGKLVRRISPCNRNMQN